MIPILITILEKVFMGMLTKLLTEKVAAKVLEPLVIAGLKRLAENTQSKVDDEVVSVVESALKGQ